MNLHVTKWSCQIAKKKLFLLCSILQGWLSERINSLHWCRDCKGTGIQRVIFWMWGRKLSEVRFVHVNQGRHLSFWLSLSLKRILGVKWDVREVFRNKTWKSISKELFVCVNLRDNVTQWWGSNSRPHAGEGPVYTRPFLPTELQDPMVRTEADYHLEPHSIQLTFLSLWCFFCPLGGFSM